ncbi:MAG: YggT family protein [Chlamydiales bacterium]|nr:YggT family protein [Chlamydiales bacterium]
MYYVIRAIDLLFTIYTLMIIIRIFGSWFQGFQQTSFFRLIAHYTDPYLNIFRRFIPPIGGVLDLSPILGFFALQILKWGLVRLILMIS